MRIGIGYIHRSMGQTSTLAAGGLTESDCEGAGTILDVSTGFCMAPSYGNAADINAAAQAAQVNVAAAAPPVYVSSYSYGPSLETQTEGTDYVAASVAQSVNDQNGRTYAAYQQAVANWVAAGSPGSPPAAPSYETFSIIWSQQGLGPQPASITTAPAGTPIPQSGYDQPYTLPITGTAPAPAPAPAAPPPAVPVPTTASSGQITQQQLVAATNAPPVNAGTVPVPAGGTSGGTLDSISSFFTESSFGGIPNWVWIAAAAGGLVLLMSMEKK